ncbi:RICIN domain-containing protein [Micromonospora sp. CPCC 205539]|uniref:RICIN domain-containing protein n=1 Tax=Micromonospora sp. CPCC 205539 TaxID=3122408 RepID=UPI002FEEC9F4
MSAPEERPDRAGTVYGGRPASRPGLLGDPMLRIALGIGLVGVLLGVVFATGLLGGGDEPVVPATVGAAEPTVAAASTSPSVEPSPTEPSPSPAATTAAVPAAGALRAASGLCLGLDGTGEKAAAKLAACTGGPEQQWVASPPGAAAVTLTNAAYGQCLDVEGGSTDDSAPLMQFPCHGQANQQWRLTATGAGPVLLIAVHSGMCGQADDDGVEVGDEIRQRPCDGRPAQQWTLG